MHTFPFYNDFSASIATNALLLNGCIFETVASIFMCDVGPSVGKGSAKAQQSLCELQF